jgi:hypothetical protein
MNDPQMNTSGKGSKGISMVNDNRYAKDWNTYSQLWDAKYGARYIHLGDEWIDDHTAEESVKLSTAGGKRFLQKATIRGSNTPPLAWSVKERQRGQSAFWVPRGDDAHYHAFAF